MVWAQVEPPVVVRVHAMYIDSNMLSVTKYTFKIPFLYSTCAMTNRMRNSSAMLTMFSQGMAYIPSVAFVFYNNLLWRYFTAILSEKDGIKITKNFGWKNIKAMHTVLWVSLYVSSRDPSVWDALGKPRRCPTISKLCLTSHFMCVESSHVVNIDVLAGVGAPLHDTQILSMQVMQTKSVSLAKWGTCNYHLGTH